MSFGFGVGDVIAAINALVAACDRYAKVPQEIREASKDANSLLTIITGIGRITADENSIAHKEQRIKEQLDLDIKEIKVDVKRLRHHIHTYERQETRSALHSATQRVLFAWCNVPEVKEIRANFTEYRNRLGPMLQILAANGHDEVIRVVREHHELNSRANDILNEIKASLAESEKRRKERDASRQNRMKEREKRFQEWENISMEDISPENVAALEVFLERKQQKLEEETMDEDVARRHMDEISTRLWDAQSPRSSPQLEAPSIQLDTESGVDTVESSARHERSNRHSTPPTEASQHRGSREPRTPVSREQSVSHMSLSRSSASSRSSHRRFRDSALESGSTTSRGRGLLDRTNRYVNSWFQGQSSTSSRRSSRVHSAAPSSVGTPRPRLNADLSADVSALSLEEPQNSNEWTTVSARAQPARSHTALNSSPSRRRTRQAPSLPRGLSSNLYHPKNILCVNWDNNALSTIAQTYFELLRLWTINTSSHWPFDRVESSGICMNAATDIDPDYVMNLLASPRSNFRSKDFPNEKDKLFHRMKHKSPCEFKKQYLEYFNYILCFDEKSYEVVSGKNSGRQQESTSEPQVRCIPLDLDHLVWKNLNYDDAINEAEKIKFVVEAFMQKRLGWECPNRKLMDGDRRTLQIPLHSRKKGIIIGTRGKNIKELREKSRCAVQIFDEGLEGVSSLVIATGQVEDLRWVEKRVNELLKPQSNSG